MKSAIAKFLDDALSRLPELADAARGLAAESTIERTRDAAHGHFASNIAMRLAKPARRSPRDLAAAIVEQIADTEQLEKVEIAGPGFINFTFNVTCWYGVLNDIAAQGQSYGLSKVGQGRKVQVEFVSANPTGPLHIGHGRGAVTGDAVASVMQAAGFDVQREYYINDAGNQMRTLGLSMLLRYRQMCGEQVNFPEDCYQGDYVADLQKP